MPDDRRAAIAKLEKDFGKPVIALPPGHEIEGRVVRIERQPELFRGAGKPPADWLWSMRSTICRFLACRPAALIDFSVSKCGSGTSTAG
jgi:hypothetical protein